MSRLGRLIAACACLAAVGGGVRAAEGTGVALNFQDVELAVLARFISDVTTTATGFSLMSANSGGSSGTQGRQQTA
jgi:hypothetical protein